MVLGYLNIYHTIGVQNPCIRIWLSGDIKKYTIHTQTHSTDNKEYDARTEIFHIHKQEN